jgi:tetratricopeptide (TPR) repeat protein
MKGNTNCPECGSENTTEPVEESYRCTDCGCRWGLDHDASPKPDRAAAAAQEIWQLLLQGRLAKELRLRYYGSMLFAMLLITDAVIHRYDLTAAGIYAGMGIGWLVFGYVGTAWPHPRFLLADGLLFCGFITYLLGVMYLEPSLSTTWRWIIIAFLLWGTIGRFRNYRRLSEADGIKTASVLAWVWLAVGATLIPADWFFATRANTHLERGTAHINRKEFHEAISEYDQVLAMHPDFRPAFFNRGLARRNLGDLAGAIADFSEAIALEPKESRGWLQRGYCHLLAGQKAEAERDFHEAFSLDPQLRAEIGEEIDSMLKASTKKP